MALTVDTFVDKVFYRIGHGLPESQVPVFRAAIEASLPTALQDLGEQVSQEHESKRALLQKSFSFTLSGGEASLTANPTLLVRTVPVTGYVLLSGITQPLQWLPYRWDLQNPPYLADFVYYTLFENKIVVRTNLGAVPSATALTVYASYVPIVSQVSDDLEDDLVLIGVNLNAPQQPQQDVNDTI